MRDIEKSAREQATRANAAAYEGRVREEAEKVKRLLARDHDCPLCTGPLGTEPHADHIHPVDRGGQSVSTNMVYVCSGCNLRKGTLSVHEFAKRSGAVFEEIASRLQALGKRV